MPTSTDASCSLSGSALVKAAQLLRAQVRGYPFIGPQLCSSEQRMEQAGIQDMLCEAAVLYLCNKKIHHLFSAINNLILTSSIRKKKYINPVHIYVRASVNITPVFQNELSGIPGSS